jgi:hypothetical protein
MVDMRVLLLMVLVSCVEGDYIGEGVIGVEKGVESCDVSDYIVGCEECEYYYGEGGRVVRVEEYDYLWSDVYIRGVDIDWREGYVLLLLEYYNGEGYDIGVERCEY